MSKTIHVPDRPELPELTLRGIFLGTVITIIFTASNVFLGLKVGLTFSSAIPAAVISMSVLRMFGGSNILENNMVQTQASAAGTLSAVIFILPALVMLGYWQGFPLWQTMGICIAGGMLGVMFTIPLRKVMVVESSLPYPEGVAAAEILRVGNTQKEIEKQQSGTGMASILTGGLVASLVSFAGNGLRVLGDSVSLWITLGAAVFRLPMGFSLALLGAGYLIGIGAGLAMLSGLIISWGIAVPILTATTPAPIDSSTAYFATSLWTSQVRFIGAGVIGIGALWTLAALFVPILNGVKASWLAAKLSRKEITKDVPRVQQDLSLSAIVSITSVLIVILVLTFSAFLSDTHILHKAMWDLVAYAVAFTIIFGFLVAAACGYMAGLVGSSTSPISGVGIVAVVLVSVFMLFIDGNNGLLADKQGTELAVALSIFTTSAVVAVASISNDNLQDLKTGWLVGATPWRQQVALLIGCIAGAVVISPVLDLLYQAYGFADAMPRSDMNPDFSLSAPQATLMLAIAKGIFTYRLNWTMVIIGSLIGVLLIIVDQILKHFFQKVRIPVLAVGIGIYLPPSVSSPIVVGAILALLIERRLRQRAVKSNQTYEEHASLPNRKGVLLASGLIVGESIVGVLMAGMIGINGTDAPLAIVSPDFAPAASWLGLVVFIIVAIFFCKRVLSV